MDLGVQETKRKVCVIGLGEVGLPTALFSKRMGLEVYGIDMDKQKADAMTKIGIPSTTSWAEMPAVDVYQVCVSTEFDGTPNVENVYAVCEEINSRLKKGDLVSIESTIYPGTMNILFEQVFDFDDDYYLVHCPQRFWGADPKHRGVNRHRLLGGIDADSINKGMYFYQFLLQMNIKQVDIEIAEFAKVAENAYRHVQIAFAEELAMECDEQGISFDDLRDAIMSASHMHWIPEARDGIGGHCIPMAAKWLTFGGFSITEASLQADKLYKKWLRR